MPWNDLPLRVDFACNGKLLRYFRRQRGWDRVRLADQAGYTKRLVEWAESGAALPADTIEALAEALTTAEKPVYPEDLCVCPETMVRTFGHASVRYLQETVGRVQHLFHEDLRVCIAGDPAEFPLAGEWRGPDGLDRYLHLLTKMVENLTDPNVPTMMEADGNMVRWVVPQTFRPKGSSQVTTLVTDNYYRVERGKIIEWRSEFDVSQGQQMVAEYQEAQRRARSEE